MPVIESISGKSCRIECWKISETTTELEALCRQSGINVTNNFTLETRYQQYMVTQLLFISLFEEGMLQYMQNGKPFASESTNSFVSISHSGDVLIMMKSQWECGVDIERIHPRVEKVKHKFLNDEELDAVKGADVITLVQYWTAKEAMFKVYGSQEVFMRGNISITDLQLLKARAELRDGQLIILRDIYFRRFEDLLIAWTEPHETK